MHRKEFYPDYTALAHSGAVWITEHSQIGLVGIDYLSIGVLHEIGDVHRTLFKKVSQGFTLRRAIAVCLTACGGGHLAPCAFAMHIMRSGIRGGNARALLGTGWQHDSTIEFGYRW